MRSIGAQLLKVEKVDLNTVIVDELIVLPHIGMRCAQYIINDCNECGPFTRLRRIQNVAYIGIYRALQMKARGRQRFFILVTGLKLLVILLIPPAILGMVSSRFFVRSPKTQNLSVGDSEPAIQLVIPAEDIKQITEKFDIVFTSYGVLAWLPDLEGWSKLIYHCLKPEGFFYIIDGHPYGQLFDENEKKDLKIKYSYFTEGKVERYEDGYTYACSEEVLENHVNYQWTHPISSIINNLVLGKKKNPSFRLFTVNYNIDQN